MAKTDTFEYASFKGSENATKNETVAPPPTTFGFNCTDVDREFLKLDSNHSRVFIAIVSSHKHGKRRDTARKTWVNWAKANNIQYRFFVGKAENAYDTIHYNLESGTHKDIVELNSRDTYDSLTEKTISLLKYVDSQIGEFDFLMKVDDDTFVRVDRLIHFITRLPQQQTYVGHFHHNVPTVVPGYKNNEIHYPKSMKELVPFASGSGYGLSSDLVNFLVKNLPMLTPYYNEDVTIGTWLFPFNVNKVNEVRLNVGYRCDNNAIIVHAVKKASVMGQLYDNSNNVSRCLCEDVKISDIV